MSRERPGTYFYRGRRMERALGLWRATVAVIALLLLLPLKLVGSPVLLDEWFYGRGPAWWHWLRREPRDRSW